VIDRVKNEDYRYSPPDRGALNTLTDEPAAKKCFIASAGAHVLLALVLMVGSAFLAGGHKPDTSQVQDYITLLTTIRTSRVEAIRASNLPLLHSPHRSVPQPQAPAPAPPRAEPPKPRDPDPPREIVRDIKPP